MIMKRLILVMATLAMATAASSAAARPGGLARCATGAFGQLLGTGAPAHAGACTP